MLKPKTPRKQTEASWHFDRFAVNIEYEVK